MSKYARAVSAGKGQHETDTSDENSSLRGQQATTHSLTTKRSVGIKTPAVMIGLLFAALVIAVGNYCLFHYLDGRPVNNALVSQSYIGAASVALAFLFKACIVASLWSATTQWLWHELRRKSAKVSTIDDLTRMLFDSTAMASWNALCFHPLLFLSVLLTWAVGIAIIFPPGALVVHSRIFEESKDMSIPVYDPTFRGNGTMHDLQHHALFEMSSVGQYFIPKPAIGRLAKQAILAHQPLTAPSPCGQNCSYSVQVSGPSYNCSPGLRDPSAVPKLINTTSIYFGNSTTSDDLFSFEAEWFSVTTYNTTSVNVQSITCNMWQSIYTINVSYLDGSQSTQASTQTVRPLPATALDDINLFYPEAQRYPNGTLRPALSIDPGLSKRQVADSQAQLLQLTAAQSDGRLIFSPSAQSYVWNDSTILPPGLQNVSTAYELSNIRAIHDAVADALSGSSSPLSQDAIAALQDYVQQNMETSFKIMPDSTEAPRSTTSTSSATPLPTPNSPASSLLLESALANFSPTDSSAVNITITARALQDLLQNTTISLLTVPNTQHTLRVLTATTQDIYDFARPMNLILPYALTLLFSALVVVAGLSSLYRNGGAATMGSFVQTLCSTQGSSTLNLRAKEAMRSGLGGEGGKELRELKVRYGRLEGGEGVGTGMMGFGTEEELVKR